ncbi:hypothetical protein DWG14_02202 [Streptomyces griseorubiginosus]|uniref:Uncharacterized protein n=1 Tax=Streptomyces griseorubiginosus TaxID=67304 RepID=A0AAI8PL78_9ACTN|nr:hypothetical protein DWG14_02202 [Streptomyces griseorubiginosus]
MTHIEEMAALISPAAASPALLAKNPQRLDV